MMDCALQMNSKWLGEMIHSFNETQNMLVRMGREAANYNLPLLEFAKDLEKKIYPWKIQKNQNTTPSTTKNLEITNLVETDFVNFNKHDLSLYHKGRKLKRLTISELKLCKVLFAEESNAIFKTKDLEKVLYPEGEPSSYKSENFEKVVRRFNKKLEKQTRKGDTVRYSKEVIFLTK
ncbi:hypothetical protein K9L27_02705 [Candidatus Gracilibacteria bacterium]|nr:hypothetical protein [Candidatus Gracilibacteria bacterium]